MGERERRAAWLAAVRGVVAKRPGPEAARAWAAAVKVDKEARSARHG